MYYIYHIPGKKVGCTKNIKQRVQYRQGFKNYEILEEHSDISIASKREIELQLEYGYLRDNNLSYEKTIKMCKVGAINSAKKSSIPILAYEYNTNKFIGEFTSIKKASEELNMHHPNIIAVLKGKIKQCSGYTFQYKVVK
jgi:hypothetical protein